MDKKGYVQATPRLTDPTITPEPWVSFSSGYIRRATDRMPKQGTKKPWRLNQNYVKDVMLLRLGAIEDGTLELTRAKTPAQSTREKVAA